MRPWSIVLAAGRGRRLASITGGVPKQFWSPDGDRSLLEETVARLSPLTPTERVVTVVDRSHGPYVARIQERNPVGTVVYQPGDSGTAAGVLLGLSAVAAAEPGAVVVITPSDHGVSRPEPFLAGIARAVTAVGRRRANVVLFGIQPHAPIGDYGWITPRSPWKPGRRVIGRVGGFMEKPAAIEAERLFLGGAVWNTMVMVARVDALLGLYETHLPRLAGTFEVARALDGRARDAFLAAQYADLPHADFSGDLVTPAQDLNLYVWPDHVGWTDLGTPDRLADWLAGNQEPSHGAAAHVSAA